MPRRTPQVIGIIQPNYLPWRGYFDIIHDVDIFVFLDDVQYTKNDWRNRNRIRTQDGRSVWLTVPVLGSTNHFIRDVSIDHKQKWAKRHMHTLFQNYGKAPHFGEYFGRVKEILERGFHELSTLDIALTIEISSWLGIKTDFVVASTLGASGVKDERLLQIVKKVGGTVYLSGPAAKAYIQPVLWEHAGVELRFKDYPDYPAYKQISEPYDPAVSIVDLLFMVGARAPEYIWDSRQA